MSAMRIQRSVFIIEKSVSSTYSVHKHIHQICLFPKGRSPPTPTSSGTEMLSSLDDKKKSNRLLTHPTDTGSSKLLAYSRMRQASAFLHSGSNRNRSSLTARALISSLNSSDAADMILDPVIVSIPGQGRRRTGFTEGGLKALSIADQTAHIGVF